MTSASHLSSTQPGRSDDGGARSQQTKIDIVQQALTAVLTGDLDAAREVVAEDFVWHIPGASKIAGDAAGPDGWGDRLRLLFAHGLQPQVIEAFEGDQRAVVLQRNVARSGERSLDVQVVNVFTVEEGKVRRLDTFFGDPDAVERFWDAVLPD